MEIILKARSTRFLLIAALFLALLPGATLAACLQPGPSSCCCETDCPKPAEARIESDSCCGMSERAPARPTHTAVTPFEAKPLDGALHRIDILETTIRNIDIDQEVKPVRGLPSPVPLFTLHDALLI